MSSETGARAPLVPLAERPFAPQDHTETAEETVWQNPNDQDVVLDLYVGIPLHIPRPSKTGRALTWEQRTGKRRYIIRAKSERAIPSEFDRAIQHIQCMEAECSQRPFDCKDRGHRWTIVGGLAPHNVIHKGMQHRPVLSPALDDIAMREQQEKENTIKALLSEQSSKRELERSQAEVEQLRAQLVERDERVADVGRHDKEQAAAKAREEAAKVPPQAQRK